MNGNDGLESTPTRRRVLGLTGAMAVTGVAGCLANPLTSGSSRSAIEPTPVGDPLAGTPGEFYTLLERNEVRVDSLYEEAGDLVLTYDTDVETEQEEDDEIGIVVTVFDEVLVSSDASYEMLYAEVADPAEDQLYGWGVETDWLQSHRDGSMSREVLWANVVNSKVYREDVE